MTLTPPNNCTACPRLCGSRLNVVNGFGPVKTDTLIVAMNPGGDEELPQNLRPLIGWSGDKVEYLADLSGMRLDNIRLENIVRCRPPRGKTGDLPPTWDEIYNCSPYLVQQVLATQPSRVITLGELPMKWWLGKKTKFSMVRGRPQEGRMEYCTKCFMLDARCSCDAPVGVYTTTVWPQYHPAAASGGRNPKLVKVMIDDWKRMNMSLPLRREELGTYELIDSEAVLKSILEDALEKGYRRFAFDFETTDPRWKDTFQARRAKSIGWSLSWEHGTALYTTCEFSKFKWFFEREDLEFIAHNAVFEDTVARNEGVYIPNLHDSKLFAYLLRRASTHLKDLSWTELGVIQTRYEDVDWDDLEQVTQYGAADSDLTLRIFNYLEAELTPKLRKLYDEIEKPLLRIICSMEMRGIGLDTRPLYDLREKLEARLEELDKELDVAYPFYLQKKKGYEKVNWRSTLDKQTILFNPPYWQVVATGEGSKRITFKEFPANARFDVPECYITSSVGGKPQVVRRFTNIQITPPGCGYKPNRKRSTDLDALYNMERQGEGIIPSLLIERTSITTALSKDTGKLPELVQEDGRVHTSFHQAGGWEETSSNSKASPETGRLSSSGPNLHNITHHGDTERPYLVEWGRQIRTGIVAQHGHKLVVADVGQEEPRIGAYKSGDKKLLTDVDSGDVYLVAASAAFGKEPGEIDKEERQIGKRMFMAWLNRAGADGIKQSAWWLSDQDAWRVIYHLREIYPGFEQWCREVIRFLREHGYTETHFGRRVERPGIYSDDAYTVTKAEMACIPDVIQGTAADILKQCMIRVENSVTCDILKGEGEFVEGLVSNVHDEVIIEIRDELVVPVAEVCLKMTDGLLPIHLPVEVTYGQSWADKWEVPL